MDGFSLKSRAIAFALCAGAFVFILALSATTRGTFDVASASRALIAAIICAAMCWAYAERTIASTAAAIDAAIERLTQAANGDLQSEIPREVEQCVPPLADVGQASPVGMLVRPVGVGVRVNVMRSRSVGTIGAIAMGVLPLLLVRLFRRELRRSAGLLGPEIPAAGVSVAVAEIIGVCRRGGRACQHERSSARRGDACQ